MFHRPLKELRYGRLRAVVDFYVPYHLFRVIFHDERAATDSLLAFDAVIGNLDPYQFDRLPEEDLRMRIHTAMTAAVRISEQDARKTFDERMMRSALMKGLYKLGRVKVEGELIETLYMPYWIGAYERRDRVRLEVIDAVRGRFEGAKMRDLVTEWFQSK
jgi:hypothetical protein